MMKAALAIPKTTVDLATIQQQVPPSIELTYWPECKDWDATTYAKHLRQVDIVLAHRSTPALPAELITNPGQLKWFAYSAGTIKHLVQLEHITKAGITVTNWGDNVYGVAESALLLIMAGLKQLKELDRFVRNDWQNDQRIASEVPATLIDRPVGIYGLGPIGRHMATILEAMQAQIHFVDPFVSDYPANYTKHDSVAAMAQHVDVLTIHCGLNDHTKASVNADVFAALPQGAVVVNTARGPIIDQAALSDALQAGKVVAGLDVIEDERTWPSCNVAPYPGVLFTGHVLSGTRSGPKPTQKKEPFALPKHMVENLQRYIADQPMLGVITAEIYSRKT